MDPNSNLLETLVLVLEYDFNKSEVPRRTISDATTSQIEICQVVRLILPVPQPGQNMTISEDKIALTIDFDLWVDFVLSENVEVEAEAIGIGSDTTNIDDYIQACKCGGAGDFVCNQDTLLPNEKLHVCIKSVSPDVEIDLLDSLVST